METATVPMTRVAQRPRSGLVDRFRLIDPWLTAARRQVLFPDRAVNDARFKAADYHRQRCTTGVNTGEGTELDRP
jgi:hypothetical protein